MSKQKLQIKSWAEVSEMLPKEAQETEFVVAVNKIAEDLAGTNKDYVYYTEFEFGKKLIDKGKIDLSQFTIDRNKYDITTTNFKTDLDYSVDPLGIVIEGFIEAFVETICNTQKFRVPIKTIPSGEVFGTFGTLDNYCGITNKYGERDWFVASGNVSSLWVATSLHNAVENALLDYQLQDNFTKSEINIDKWIKFINHYKGENWAVKIVYFPKHIISLIEERYISALFKIGWKQSYPLRHVLFSDNTISNKIKTIGTEKLHHDKIFLNNIYNFILKVINAELGCFIPLTDETHYFYKALQNFKISNISSQEKLTFLPFHFCIIPENGYGILSMNLLPILFDYQISSLNDLFKDLDLINGKFNDEKYKIMNHIEGYGNTGNKTGKMFVKLPTLLKENILSNSFNIPKEKINLTSKEFANIILIKRKTL